MSDEFKYRDRAGLHYQTIENLKDSKWYEMTVDQILFYKDKTLLELFEIHHAITDNLD